MKQRLDALDTELAGIEAEIEALTAEHAEHVSSGADAKADAVHGQIVEARQRMEAAQARREPLERAVATEEAAERAKAAKVLTTEADAKLDAIEAKFAEAAEAAAKLTAICNELNEHAALHWSIAAHKAAEAGGSPQRRPLEVGDTMDNAPLRSAG